VLVIYKPALAINYILVAISKSKFLSGIPLKTNSYNNFTIDIYILLLSFLIGILRA